LDTVAIETPTSPAIVAIVADLVPPAADARVVIELSPWSPRNFRRA
jgi:hypothetical protein